jgi:hypothetical protein
VGVGQRALSLCPHGGGTPSPLLAPGRVTSSRHLIGVWSVLLWHCCYMERVVFNHLSESLNPFIHTGGPHRGRSFHCRLRQWRRWHGSWSVEMTSYIYVVASEYVTARLTLRKASAASHRSGYSWSLWPTRLTLDPDVPPCYVNVRLYMYTIALLFVNSCPGRLQRLGTTPTPTDLDVRRDVSVAPGGILSLMSKLLAFIILLTTPRGH